MLSALLGATSALVDGSRSAVLRRASAPRCAATDCPLSNLNCPFGTTSPPAPPPSAAVAESLERVAESLESSLQSSLGIERPLACVVVEDGQSLTLDELREFLADRVAKWWLPDALELVDEVPKTSVGKFSKRTLRERFADYTLPTA